MKRCGKSAPLGQQCTRHGKPHTEQDQIGKEFRIAISRMRLCSRRQGERSFDSSESLRISAAGLNARRTPQLSGRSLEPFSDGRPRGMTVSGGNAVQNSAYRSGIFYGPWIRKDSRAFNFAARDPSTRCARSGFRLQAHACKAPQLAALRFERIWGPSYCRGHRWVLRLRSGFRQRAL